MKVSLAAEAELELVSAAHYYANQADAALGEAFIREFERSAKLLGEYPQIGFRWRGLMRRFPLRRFPFSIVYVVTESEVRILAIAHQRRRPGYWRSRL